MTIIEKISAARSTFFRANGFLPNTVRINMADYRQLCEWARLARHVVINPATGEATILNPIPEKLDKIFGMRIVKRAGEMECAFDAALNSARNLLNAGLTGIESREQINAEIDAIVSNGDKSGRPFVMKRDHSLCRHDIPAINCTECFVAPKIDLRDAIKRDDPTGGYGTCVHGNDFMTCAKCIPPIEGAKHMSKAIYVARNNPDGGTSFLRVPIAEYEWARQHALEIAGNEFTASELELLDYDRKLSFCLRREDVACPTCGHETFVRIPIYLVNYDKQDDQYVLGFRDINLFPRADGMVRLADFVANATKQIQGA